jgi:hypothetical protein
LFPPTYILRYPDPALQIPYDHEEIRRALIAVHDFAVPQIKVLFSLFCPSLYGHSLVLTLCVLLPMEASGRRYRRTGSL